MEKSFLIFDFLILTYFVLHLNKPNYIKQHEKYRFE